MDSHGQQASPSTADSQKKLRVICLSIATALFLTIFKLVIGFAAHSLAVIASAFDSLMDVLVSSVNLIAVREADKPADKEHMYGQPIGDGP